MRELSAQAVLLARSFEEADPEGLLVTGEERHAATLEGRDGGGTFELQADRRARAILACVEREVPSLARVRAWTRVGLVLIGPVVLVAFATGLATNALGPSRQINLLAFPLLALVVWNLSIYALLVVTMVASALRRRPDRETEGAAGPAQASPGTDIGFLGSVTWWIGEWALERVRTPDPRRAEVVSRALGTYWSFWSQRSAALGVARLRAFLHLGAAALAVGVVVGMYVRGLGLEYRATWESTFLSAEVVASLLKLVLGPAAALLGSALPDAVGLEAMAAPEGSTSAAPWIHLWAVTTAGLVVVPRIVLATAQFARAAGLAGAVAVEPVAGSFRALLRPERGAGTRVDVLPYSYRIGPRSLDTLRELLHDLFGLEASIDPRASVPYGTEVAGGGHDGPSCVVIVYGLVQSPEREVHARYLEEWMQRGGEPMVLAVVDSASWRERFGDGEGQRQAERLRAWDRVLREIGLEALHVDLGRPLVPGTIERADAVLWPESSTARAAGGR